jgi:hypothetical protein
MRHQTSFSTEKIGALRLKISCCILQNCYRTEYGHEESLFHLISGLEKPVESRIKISWKEIRFLIDLIFSHRYKAIS